MCTFLSAGLQKCVPSGGTAATAAWGQWQESWAPRAGCCCWEQKSSLAHSHFQTLTGEVLKTNTLEIKCTHINNHTYIHTYIYMYVPVDSGIQQALGPQNSHGRDLHPSALSPLP